MRKRVALALSEIMVASANGVNWIAYRSFAMAGYWDTLVTNAFGKFPALLKAVTLNPAMGVYLNTLGNQKEDTATGRQPDENYAREVLQLLTIPTTTVEQFASTLATWFGVSTTELDLVEPQRLAHGAIQFSKVSATRIAAWPWP